MKRCRFRRLPPWPKTGIAGADTCKPPEGARFPAVLIIHPGNRELLDASLKGYVLNSPVRRVSCGRLRVCRDHSRDIDPWATAATEDTVAALDFLRELPYRDPQSVVAYGCSNGGDLALEAARAADVAAIAAEERRHRCSLVSSSSQRLSALGKPSRTRHTLGNPTLISLPALTPNTRCTRRARGCERARLIRFVTRPSEAWRV